MAHCHRRRPRCTHELHELGAGWGNTVKHLQGMVQGERAARWKDALGLDHFERRSFRGWHHHVTLAGLAHGFFTLQRLDPEADAPA